MSLILIALISLTAANYDNLVPADTAVKTLVFVRSGCSGCEQMKPFIKELQNEGFDITIVEDLSLHSQYKVRAVPVTVVLENGKEIKRHVGYLSKSDFKDFIAT